MSCILAFRVTRKLVQMKYKIIDPDTKLQSHVQYFWTLEVGPDSCNIPIRTFVDDSTGMLLEFSSDSKGCSPRRSMIYGQTTSPTFNPNKEPFFVLGVLFQPYAIKELFNVDAHELTNQRINLNDFFEPQFLDMIASNHNLFDKVNTLSTYISRNLTAIKYVDELVKHCISYIKKNGGMLTVKDLLVKFRISERQLERRFKEVVGVSPRHYLKITKFRYAVSLLSGTSGNNLTEVAFELNYFDQSHFIRQAKELSGLCPKDLKRGITSSIVNLIL